MPRPPGKVGYKLDNAQCGNFRIFSITQILREINFWDSRSAKPVVFAISRAVKFVDLVEFSLQKVQKITKIKIQSV